MSLPEIINNLYRKYDDVWSGNLYRSGNSGIYYHTNQEGASFYGDDVKTFECPKLNNVLVVDLEDVGSMEKIAELADKTYDEFIEDDIALGLEEVIPILFSNGFEAIVIEGETGAEVEGIPIEVVFPSPLKSEIENIADSI